MLINIINEYINYCLYFVFYYLLIVGMVINYNAQTKIRNIYLVGDFENKHKKGNLQHTLT